MIEHHILTGVRFEQTPNVSPGVITPKYLIIHYSASLTTEGTVNWLCNPKARVSAHIVIGRKGEVIQLAKFNQKAWHCGISEWNREEGMNDRSIGIELIGVGHVERDKDGKFWYGSREIPADEVEQATHKNETEPRYWHKYTPEQIDVCIRVAAEIFHTYGLKDILGHDDIAPTRKTDPGPLFPMDRIKNAVMADGVDSMYPKAFRARDLYFTPALGTVGSGFYVTIEDREGDVDRLITEAEARALRDWLNENLSE